LGRDLRYQHLAARARHPRQRHVPFPEGAILVGTIIAWNVFIDWLNFRVPALQEWLEAPPLLLVQNGRVLHRNLRHEFVTEEELSEVAAAHMESDGTVSVIKRSARGA
jgi:uncharacterized membrane protein YcaP (DUF421 family)